ncbi:selenide, water dikinase SelD [Candidatus Methylomicrobium oryzae]|uniref:selenide, water dikinase SelD n=1 Tax=Candidatus Methylomicrobium oryzae TaxID=2802053 RepID=UPI001923D533|nr:selenide, water dikinase SelD [Methylomicrobium sp. RS1]MBL1264729.1 selenide, water dikinase SelD [Methylomicrobium sp. RS1]
MNHNPPPIVSDLVLLGGGHANIQVLKRFAMNPIGGLRVTLISDQTHSPYSGMLPGYLAGYYDYEECHFDLRRLCEELGQRFVKAKIIGIDPQLKKVRLEGRPEIGYDCASINVGIAPRSIGNPATGSTEKLIPMKPISQFIAHWDRLIEGLKVYRGREPLALAVVGAGAGGVEIAIILKMLIDRNGWHAKVSLIHRHDFLVSAKDVRAGKQLAKTLDAAGIKVLPNTEVLQLQESGLLLKDNQGRLRSEAFYRILVATEAAAPPWFAASGLAVDRNGFVKVDEKLRVENGDALFAAGDCIHFTPSPLKKAGVYAVRQGAVLEHNLRAFFTRQSAPKIFRPKKHVLSLITTGDRQAIVHQDDASILRWLSPSLLWRVKDRIDRHFMRRFQARSFPAKPQHFIRAMPKPKFSLVPDDWRDNTCGGCGSKVAASALAQSLEKLDIPPDDAVLLGAKDGEDCALTRFGENRLCLQSLDQFRSFISDPFVFGQIAAQHALSDIYAMGGAAKTAQVGLTLPPASERIHREDIFQIMSGVLNSLTLSGVSLVGGHTGEGAELAIAVSVQGEVEAEKVLRKRLTRPGDRLILTKPIGTGVLLAANMLAQANGKWVDAALLNMRQSNRAALEAIRPFAIGGCTDVTGFGLAGHAFEMMRDNSTLGVQLVYRAIPLLDGVAELFGKGYAASLAERNFRSVQPILGSKISPATHPALFDPQTSGGLLFSIRPEQTEACLSALHRSGVIGAAVIGEVIGRPQMLSV